MSMLEGISSLAGVTTWVEIFRFWAGNHKIHPWNSLR